MDIVNKYLGHQRHNLRNGTFENRRCVDIHILYIRERNRGNIMYARRSSNRFFKSSSTFDVDCRRSTYRPRKLQDLSDLSDSRETKKFNSSTRKYTSVIN